MKNDSRLNFILKQMEMTQRMLAQELGCSRSLVHQWAHGRRPSERFLDKVCDVLGVEPDMLWPAQ